MGSGSHYVSGGIVQGSDDNENWTDLVTFTNPNTAASAVWDIPITGNTHYYNYHRIYINTGNTNTIFQNLYITATYWGTPKLSDYSWAAGTESRYYIKY